MAEGQSAEGEAETEADGTHDEDGKVATYLAHEFI
jgi:hypothetical protein